MSTSANQIERCFVIGPIGDQLADQGSEGRESYERAIEIFENVIQAACSEFSIEAYRADNIDKPGEISDQIFTALRDEAFVIADLTGANPNVMYELGLRHTTNKITIQIGEKERLPFDVQNIRTIMFKRTPAGLITAKKRLATAIGTTLAQGFDPSAATRIWLAGSVGPGSAVTGAVLSAGSGVDFEEEPLGSLELVADAEEALPAFVERMASLTALTGEIGDLASAHSLPLQNAESTAHKLSAVHRFTVELDPLVRRFDQESVELESQARLLGGGVLHLVGVVAESIDEAGESERELVQSVAEMGAASSESIGGMRGFYDSTEQLLNVSSKLRPTIRLLRASLERLLGVFEEVGRWGESATKVLSELPPLEDEPGEPESSGVADPS